MQRRRDAFCGKISVCNNLRQYGIPFTLTERHTIGLSTDEFKRELTRVPRRVPRRPRHAAGAGRRHRRAAERVQHDALQREALRSERHQREHARSVRSARWRQAPGRRRQPRHGQARRHHRLCRGARRAECGADAHGEARRHRLGVDDGARSRRHRHSVLELAAEELRRQLLHDHEHDEREAHAQRVRSGRRRHRRDVRAAARVRQAERPRRLEQQLRRRSGQVRVLPLRQLGQGLPARHHDRHRTDPGHHPGRREHLWRARRPHAARPGDLRPGIDRRSRRVHPRLRRRGPVHRRPAQHLRHARRRPRAAVAAADAATSAAMDSSITRR